MQTAQAQPFKNMTTMRTMQDNYAAAHPLPSSNFKVDKGIPLPEKRALCVEKQHNREARLLLSSMSVNDSVFLPTQQDYKIFNYAAGKLKKRESKSFAIRRVQDNGWRIWRTK